MKELQGYLRLANDGSTGWLFGTWVLHLVDDQLSGIAMKEVGDPLSHAKLVAHKTDSHFLMFCLLNKPSAIVPLRTSRFKTFCSIGFQPWIYMDLLHDILSDKTW